MIPAGRAASTARISVWHGRASLRVYLKIDLEFVRHLGSNPGNQHLVKSIVYLARGFGHQTIAEGVEDAETLALLRVYGVDYAQGFHIGLPAPAEGRRLSSARSSSNGRAPD